LLWLKYYFNHNIQTIFFNFSLNAEGLFLNALYPMNLWRKVLCFSLAIAILSSTVSSYCNTFKFSWDNTSNSNLLLSDDNDCELDIDVFDAFIEFTHHYSFVGRCEPVYPFVLSETLVATSYLQLRVLRIWHRTSSTFQSEPIHPFKNLPHEKNHQDNRVVVCRFNITFIMLQSCASRVSRH